MNRYRENIQRQNSNALKNNVLEEYGMTSRELKTDRKEPISKSKSKKDIMIAKNKKLPQSFTASRMNQQEIKSPKHRQAKSNKKQGQFFQIWQKSSTYTREQQDGLNGMKTSKFGFDSINDKENNQLKSSRQIQIKPQTYFSDRVEAFELSQRLKKSTSMKNLIEQRFMQGNVNEKNQQKQIENRQNKDATKPYDSTKYNWRLSKSKQKLQKQKSLSALSCRAKLMCDLQKKQSNCNKLTLDNPIEKKQNRPKLKSQQILSFEYNPQNIAKRTNRTQGKRANHPQTLSYTFGSDVMNSLQFG